MEYFPHYQIYFYIHMKKIISCLLLCFLIGGLSSVANAHSVKSKIFIEKSIVSKTEVVNSDNIENYAYASVSASNIVYVAIKTNFSFEKTINYFLKPDKVYLRYRQIIHYTYFDESLPKHYLLP